MSGRNIDANLPDTRGDGDLLPFLAVPDGKVQLIPEGDQLIMDTINKAVQEYLENGYSYPLFAPGCGCD